jgi:hypothetical protein
MGKKGMAKPTVKRMINPKDIRMFSNQNEGAEGRGKGGEKED